MDFASVDFASVLSSTDSLARDSFSWPDKSNLPMHNPKTHLDHSDRYNHSSPSSTTTSTVLSGPSSTPALSLLDGSLVLSPAGNDALFPPYSDDMSNAIIAAASPQSTKTSSSVPLPVTPENPNTTDLLVPGLTLPKPTTGNGRPAKRGRPSASEAKDRDATPTDLDIIAKRQRNNLAAKKYRQKKIDRIEELEHEVDEIKKERDELRIELAKKEAETAALREMLKIATAASQKTT